MAACARREGPTARQPEAPAAAMPKIFAAFATHPNVPPPKATKVLSAVHESTRKIELRNSYVANRRSGLISQLSLKRIDTRQQN
jgi:hypothetical protein